MKHLFSTLSLLLLLTLPAPLTAGDDHQDEKSSDAEAALCNVCRVHEGENDPEPIAATASFEGTTYGFCSNDCRDNFLEAPAAYLPPVFPRPAPSFIVNDLDGESFSSDELAGRVVLLDFWATWCPPCLKDLPELTSLHQRYEKRGLTVLSVSIDEGDDAIQKIRRMIKKRGAEHPIYHDGNEASAWAAYQVRVVPAQFLIDQNGAIVAQWSGATDLSKVENRIVELLE